jgi:hypothetical protein
MLKFNKQFSEIVKLAEQARYNTYQSINSELVNLYWQIGEYISKKVANAEWGMNVVDKLAAYFQENASDLKGFDRRGLYRMKQFYEAYQNLESLEKSTPAEVKQIVSPVVTQLKKSKVSKQKERVGILLCKQKDDEVVEFALSRNMSPALVSKYKTKLLNKQLLKKDCTISYCKIQIIQYSKKLKNLTLKNTNHERIYCSCIQNSRRQSKPRWI